jgi:hypothetical protein
MKTIAGVLIAATLALGNGCAKTDWIERTLVTVDVTGTWERVESTLQLELKQQGPNVNGYLRMPAPAGQFSGPIEGSVAGDTFRFRRVNGFGDGEMTVSGDEMTGQIRGLPTTPQATLRRVDPSSPPASPPR